MAGSYYDEMEPLIVASLGEGGYDWSEVNVFEKDGELRWGASAGCSCNSFGDDYPTFESLEELSDSTWNDLHQAVDDMSESYASFADKTEFLAKVAKLMRGGHDRGSTELRRTASA